MPSSRKPNLTPSTLRVYSARFRAFCAFCAESGKPALPIEPLLVVAWLRELVARGAARSTLSLSARALDHMAERAGCALPCAALAVRAAMPKLRTDARRRERRDRTQRHTLTLRFSDAELERLQAAARAAGRSLRRLARERVVAG